MVQDACSNLNHLICPSAPLPFLKFPPLFLDTVPWPELRYSQRRLVNVVAILSVYPFTWQLGLQFLSKKGWIIITWLFLLHTWPLPAWRVLLSDLGFPSIFSKSHHGQGSWTPSSTSEIQWFTCNTGIFGLECLRSSLLLREEQRFERISICAGLGALTSLT